MFCVAVLAMKGVLDSSLGISLDLMNAAHGLTRSSGAASLKVQCVSASNSSTVMTNSGQRISNLVKLREADRPDVVLLPGCNVNEVNTLRAWLAAPEVARVQAWLTAVAPRARVIAGGCVGAFAMAGAGLLDGRAATTTWWLAPEFRQRFPNVTLDMHRMVVDEGKFITAGAALAQADLTLHVIERLYGPNVAALCSSYMLVDERLSQSHYAIMSHLSRKNPDVLLAENWIRANMGRAFTITELAAAINLTPRTLARRFIESTGAAPNDFIQRVRIERASHLLRTTKISMQRVAEEVGYQDMGALRRVFKRLGYPMPTECRHRPEPTKPSS